MTRFVLLWIDMINNVTYACISGVLSRDIYGFSFFNLQMYLGLLIKMMMSEVIGACMAVDNTS